MEGCVDIFSLASLLPGNDFALPITQGTVGTEVSLKPYSSANSSGYFVSVATLHKRIKNSVAICPRANYTD
jgi:hypothetical protein